MKSKYTFNEIEGFLDKCNATGIKILNGTSKQFLKADGSLDTKEYLSTAGGKISSNLTIEDHLTVGKTATLGGRLIMKTYIRFNQYNEEAEYLLGMTTAGNPLQWYDGTQWNTILHSGNYSNLIGNTYLKTNGSNTMTNGLQLFTLSSGSVNVPMTDGVFIYRGPQSGGADVGLPNEYTNLLNIGGSNAYSNLQLAWFRSSDELKLYARVGESKGYGAWKEILHQGNYADYALPISGGTIAGKSWNPLHIKSDNENSTAITLAPSSGNGLQLGWTSTQGAFLYNYQNACQIGVHPDEYPYFKTYTNLYTILHSGNFKNLIGNTYLKITGGTMEGDISMGYSKRIHMNGGIFEFNDQSGSRLAWLRGITDNLQLYNGSWYTLIHEGNVGDYALKVNGSNAMNRDALLTWKDAGGADYDTAVYGIKAYIAQPTGASLESIVQYATVLNVGNGADNYVFQLASGVNSSSPLYFRPRGNTSWGDWKTIAFTDSDITGNAATATALKNSVSLWGQSFDGTGDVSGILKLGYSLITGGNNENAFELASDALTIGYGYRSRLTTIYGGTLRFAREGAISMLINSSGNVTIGAEDLAGSDHKLYIIGGLRVRGVVASGATLGEKIAGASVFGAEHFGLQFWTYTSGSSNMQSGRFDGAATAYALNLNPLGGAVNVGEGGLNVAGKTILGETVAFTTGVTYYERAGANYLWANKGGYFVIGVGANAGLQHAALAIYNNGVHPGNRNNAVSLGASSYRWSNVYSTLGNFSSRVLIGAVTDDTESALQVKGAIKTYSSTNDLKFYTRILGAAIQVGRTSSVYTGGYNCGLLLGEDNTTIAYIAGAYDDKNAGMTNFFYGGKSADSSPFVISLHDDITYLRSSRTIIRYALEVNSTANFGGQSTFNAGITIPSGQSITFVDASGNNHVLS